MLRFNGLLEIVSGGFLAFKLIVHFARKGFRQLLSVHWFSCISFISLIYEQMNDKQTTLAMALALENCLPIRVSRKHGAIALQFRQANKREHKSFLIKYFMTLF